MCPKNLIHWALHDCTLGLKHFISSFPRRGTEFTHFLFLISERSVSPPTLPSWQRDPGSS